MNREFVDSDAATSTTRASRKVRATSSRRHVVACRRKAGIIFCWVASLRNPQPTQTETENQNDFGRKLSGPDFVADQFKNRTSKKQIFPTLTVKAEAFLKEIRARIFVGWVVSPKNPENEKDRSVRFWNFTLELIPSHQLERHRRLWLVLTHSPVNFDDESEKDLYLVSCVTRCGYAM